MRLLAVLYLFSLTTFSVAEVRTQNIEADGALIYKSTQGTLDKLGAVLSLPARGQGDIYLTIDGKAPLKADRFFSEKKNGRTLFYVVFKKNHFDDVDFKRDQSSLDHQLLVFVGTYLRGSNLALYYGDIFFGSNREIRLLQSGDRSDNSFNYVGGFKFFAPVR